MSFAEFDAVCSGFEAFHAPQDDDSPGAPSVEQHKRAMGLLN